MTFIMNKRGFSTAEHPQDALRDLAQIIAKAIHASYPERYK